MKCFVTTFCNFSSSSLIWFNFAESSPACCERRQNIKLLLREKAEHLVTSLFHLYIIIIIIIMIIIIIIMITIIIINYFRM